MHSSSYSAFNKTALLILPPNCKYIHLNERNWKSHRGTEIKAIFFTTEADV
jgi:hypothetical protein